MGPGGDLGGAVPKGTIRKRRTNKGQFPARGWNIRVTPNALQSRRHLWESGAESMRWKKWRKVNKGEEESVMKQIPGWHKQSGRGREEFQLGGYSRIVPRTHILSSCIV